jgi:hypothetical protein
MTSSYPGTYKESLLQKKKETLLSLRKFPRVNNHVLVTRSNITYQNKRCTEYPYHSENSQDFRSCVPENGNRNQKYILQIMISYIIR